MQFYFLLILMFASSNAFSAHPNVFLENLKDEPTFSEIVSKAFKKEKLDWEEVTQLKKKSKIAPWLPQLYLGYDHSFRENSDLSIADNISVTSSGVTVGPDKSDYDRSLNETDTVRVRAVWNLDELVFNRNNFQVHRLQLDVYKARQGLTDHLFKVYSMRRSLLTQYYRSSRSQKIKIYHQIASLTDQLDFITEGIFKERWSL